MITARPRVTLDEYYAFCALPENAERVFEWIDWEIVEKMPSGVHASIIASWLSHLLWRYLEGNPIGLVSVEQGMYRMNDSTIFVPDVAFITHARLSQIPARGKPPSPVPPDLAVEVLSPTDRLRDARAKAERYLANGVRLVWLVMPESRMVEVYTPDTDVTTLHADDTLSGGDVLPGFSAPVRELFPHVSE